MVRTLMRVVCLLALSSVGWRVAAADLPLHDGSVARLADKQAGAEAITRQDHFIESLGPLDRRARLNTSRDVSTDDHLKFLAEQVRDWDEPEGKKLAGVFESLRKKLAPWKLNFPPVVLVVKTTGEEESHASYCRGLAIVLPARMAAMRADHLERLLTHELFHVLSSHNPELRQKLYATIGFQPCPPFDLPAELAARKITNPDAPDFNWYMSAAYHDRPLTFVPLLLLDSERFDPNQAGGFLRHIQFRLLAIEQAGDAWRVKLDDGHPLLVEHKDVPDFLQQVGNNTQYVVHPEEILADNFILLVDEQQNVATPRILDQMREIIGRKE